MTPWEVSQKRNLINIKVMARMNITTRKTKCMWRKIPSLNNNRASIMDSDSSILSKRRPTSITKKKITKMLIIQISKILDSNNKKHKVNKRINSKISHSSEILLSFLNNKPIKRQLKSPHLSLPNLNKTLKWSISLIQTRTSRSHNHNNNNKSHSHSHNNKLNLIKFKNNKI